MLDQSDTYRLHGANDEGCIDEQARPLLGSKYGLLQMAQQGLATTAQVAGKVSFLRFWALSSHSSRGWPPRH